MLFRSSATQKTTLTKRHVRQSVRLYASPVGSSNTGGQLVVPVFPLPGIVAMPHANLPLTLPAASEHQAFFAALCSSPEEDSSLSQASTSRPVWHGSRRFGACQAQNAEGGMNLSPVGTLMEVTDMQQLPDGRLRLVARGQQRFQIAGVEGSEPLLMCRIDLLKEEAAPKQAPEVMRLAGEVLSLIPNYLRVYVRARAQELGSELPSFVASLGPDLTRSSFQAWLTGKADDPDIEARVMCGLAHLQPEQLDLYSMRPAEVSYFVASLFTSMPELQQQLLQEGSTLMRLQMEREVLQSR